MVKTPCIKVCRINPETMLCDGCSRTLEEVQRWMNMPEADRKHTLDLIAERKRCGKPMIPHN